MGNSLLFAMSLVVLTWLVLLALLVGLGLGLQRLIGMRRVTTSSILLSPWNGFALVILFLQIWHFVFPIRWPALVVLAIIASVGLWFSRRELSHWFGSIHIGPKLGAALALVVIWTANRAVGAGNAFDSGLYHYSVVRWSHEYSIVPGLANLHPQFGFNNACHLFVAMLKVGFWETRANHLANGLLLCTWLGTSVVSAARLMRGTGSRAQNLFNVVLLVPLVMYGVSKEASSPTSDLPQTMATFAAASAFVRLLARDVNDRAAERSLTAITAVILGATALCNKLTAASTVVPLGLIALAVYLLHTRSIARRRSTALWACGLATALGLTWAGRSFVLSGCPFYPSRLLAPAVDWQVVTDNWPGLNAYLRLAGESIRIDMLQRAMSSPEFRAIPRVIANPLHDILREGYTTRAWLVALLVAATIEVALPTMLALVAIIATAVRARSRRSTTVIVKPIEWLVCLPPVIGIAVWVIVSPEPRYAASTFWMLGAAMLGIMMRNTVRTLRFVSVVVCMAGLPIAYRALVLKLNPVSGPLSSALVILAGPDHGFQPVPVVELVARRPSWDLTVYVPKDPGPPWDAPLPATAFLDPRLRLRQTADLASGFRIEQKGQGNAVCAPGR